MPPLATFRPIFLVADALVTSTSPSVMDNLQYEATYLHSARHAIAEFATKLPTRAGTGEPKLVVSVKASSYRSSIAARHPTRRTTAKQTSLRAKDALARTQIN